MKINLISKRIYFLFIPIITTILITTSCKESNAENTETAAEEPIRYTSFVDPFIGTSGHGHTFPGAALPFGMVQLSPDTYDDEWDWCSGYHYSDSSLMGFSHTHLSGTGRSDLLDILMMPTTGELKYEPGTRENPDEGYRSRFSHDDEVAKPGYYAVKLKDYNIDVELTTTKRVGFHKYNYPKGEKANVILDLTHGRPNDTVMALEFKLLNDSTIAGMRHTHGWRFGKEKHFIDQKIYFVAEFSKPFSSLEVKGDKAAENEWNGTEIKAGITFDALEEPLMVKVALSPVDIDGAKKNLKAELSHWNFEQVKETADKTWEENLQKIEITDADTSKKTAFYTAMYHSFLAPYLYQDVDGRYPGSDGEIHTAEGFTNYTLFSLWDTFRSLHPLLTITHPELVNDLINSMLAVYDESGLLPEWHLATSETFTMIGYHAVPVILDAYQKGINDFDFNKAYEGMKANANYDDFGRPLFREMAYIPSELTNKSVSRALEFAYDDWCILQSAKILNKEEDIEEYKRTSNAFKNIFDKKTLFMRGKDAQGNWVKDFDPTLSTHNYSDYIEGNAWQYTWFVPHDVPALIDLMGGEETFEKKLDSLFIVSSDVTGENVPSDMSGFIGQYVHGNEPSHHIAYLYNFIGKPEKTRKWTKKIMDELYTDQPDGLSGNEDCGQMSAWFVLSSMGFHPVNPANGKYQLGYPLFDEVKVKLNNGKSFSVSQKNDAGTTWKINGKQLDRTYIQHNEITSGSELIFE
ncbi:GH92 family glycosyl hydrolase [Galbibacter mesophilus]|uniref:GH92 family glycosyl hydrolase n=1 Tax=Galbibacter mesophilus TaxID=379069 RepID=UPI00191F1E63|nr:GH92 family glycosyl hydrolase [Galbibacter mesophilus]MCM5663871.1 GH92 family glycosyl hydrolase [Galbibacter mesophilus]